MSQWRNEEASSCCHHEGADKDTPLLHTSTKHTQCEKHFLLTAEADHEFKQLLTNKVFWHFSQITGAKKPPLSQDVISSDLLSLPLAMQRLMQTSKKTLEIYSVLYTLCEAPDCRPSLGETYGLLRYDRGYISPRPKHKTSWSQYNCPSTVPQALFVL